MLNETREFFKREKKYAVFFAVLCLIYGVLIFLRAKNPEIKSSEDSHVLAQFKKAEDRVQAKVKNMGSMEAYLKDQPRLAFWINIFSGVFVLALIAGVVIDCLLISRPEFRSRFQVERAPPEIDWKLSLIFKFFIWFFAVNVAVSLVLGLFQRFFDVNQNFFLLLHTTCAEFVSFFVIFWIVRRNGGTLKAVGFNLPEGSWFKEMKIGWGAYLAILPVFGMILLALLAITQFFKYEPPPHPLVPIFLEEGTRSQGIVIYSLVLASFFGPIFEEIFFRGFCYPILKKRFGVMAAMVVTSSFFAFIHDSTFAFWPIFILGMALNYVYEKRGSLLGSITLHVTHNLLFLTYFFLAKDIISREMGV